MRTPPAEGLTWSPERTIEEVDDEGRKTGETWVTRARWVFKCGCDREQGYAPADQSGGVTVEEAETLGWRKVDGKWVCPFCNGNTENLRKVFEGNG